MTAATGRMIDGQMEVFTNAEVWVPLNVGSVVKLVGIRHMAKVTGIDRGFIELRRIHPETGELEGGEPIIFRIEHIDVAGVAA